MMAIALILILSSSPIAQVVREGSSQPAAASAALAAIAIAGPESESELAARTVQAFAAKHGNVSLRYLRGDPQSAAIRHFVGSAGLLLVWGKPEAIPPEILTAWAGKEPADHFVGARCAVVVVHPQNKLSALSLEQLGTLINGTTVNWKQLGGADRPIRLYGPTGRDVVVNLVAGWVMPEREWRRVIRKGTAAEIAEAVATDVDAVGLMDYAEAASRKLKMLGLAGRGNPVVPNVQTVKDGTYRLSSALRVYVAKNANPAEKALADYVLSGECDAMLREQGILPGLRAVRRDVADLFEKLFGTQLRKAKASAESDDDVALGQEMVNLTQQQAMEPALLQLVCEESCNLALAGQATDLAVSAMVVLANKVPDLKLPCQARVVAALEAQVQKDLDPQRSQQLLAALLTLCDLADQGKEYGIALEACRKAVPLVEALEPSSANSTKRRLRILQARCDADREASALRAEMGSTLSDPTKRKRLLWLELTELDRPQEAGRLLEKADREDWLTHVPLAVTPPESLGAEAALRLAEWYVQLSGEASEAGKDKMLRRGGKLYEHVLSKLQAQKEQGSPLMARAQLGIARVKGSLGEATTTSAPGSPAAAKLATLVPAADGWVDILTNAEPKAPVMKWEREAEGLRLIPKTRDFVDFAAPCAGSYEMRAVFTTRDIYSFHVLLPCEGSAVEVLLRFKESTIGTSYGKKEESAPITLEPGKDYDFHVKLNVQGAEAEVTAALNGNVVLQFKGQIKQFGSWTPKDGLNSSMLRLRVSDGPVLLKTLAVRPMAPGRRN